MENNNKFYKENIAIAQLFKLGAIFIAIFGFYVQFHGKVSPGGGFQSGIVIAILFMIYEGLFFVINQRPEQFIKSSFFKYIAATGVLCYALTGFSCFLFKGAIFDYSTFSTNFVVGQQIGIFFIECGVGLAVFGSMMTIYRSLIKELGLSNI